MALSETQIEEVEAKLTAYSPVLAEAFRRTAENLPAGLTESQTRLWIDEGLALAGHSLRSWEAGGDYFHAGIEVLPQLDDHGYRVWAAAGRTLAEAASGIAAAYYRVSPEVLPSIAGAQVREWAGLGERLYKATWKSISLSSEFFNHSPQLLTKLTLSDLARFGKVLEGISDRSADLAAACLDASPIVVRDLDHAELIAFLDFAAAIADSAWPEASLYFQRGPDLLRGVESGQRAHYLDLSTRVARRLGRQAYVLFAEGSLALKDVRGVPHGHLIELADQLVGISPIAAMSFIKSASSLTERLRLHELDAWHAAGLELLHTGVEGGEAYFRLESGKAEQMISQLSARVDLGGVSDLLRLYSKALTGANVAVQSVANLEEKGIGWVSERGPTTEGTSVYLPDFIEYYDNKPENFAVYKVYATHQTAHIEFGSFDFSFRREGSLPRRRQDVEADLRAQGVVTKDRWLTEMERYFDLFTDRQLAADLFTTVEDLRIDARVHEEYSGIKRANRQVQLRELAGRPDPRTLPLRTAFVENMIRASLDGEDTIVWPKALTPLLAEAILALRAVKPVESIVEDSAEATLSLYQIAERVPNVPPQALEDLDWDTLSQEDLENLEQESQAGQDEMQEALDDMADDESVPYESPDQVNFRGDFKPEMVQLLMRMRLQQTDEQSEEELAQLTPEQIKELLEKSVEIDTDDEFDMSAFNAFLENLEKEAGQQLPDDEDVPDDAPIAEPGPVPADPNVVRIYLYDEWDFRASDYKPRWCTVRERFIEEGTDDFYAKTLGEHKGLINETQRQFELLKPETFRKLKQLEDGEDIDLDAALDFVVQKRAGHGGVPKIYWRRNKVERDVAVAFLLDMSASTDEEIEKRRPRNATGPAAAGQPDGDPRRYYQYLAQNRSQSLVEPPKRIIDLERESLVLLTRALETIHDRYGIYGFSGYGRENVEYYVIKDFDETFSDIIRRRIDKVTPIRSTRMGPAIRHTTHKLEESDAKAKILFLVSDGRPQDHGYGRDRTEKEYAIHDTHKALVEAKHKGIVPFALTVDKEGHDYLGQMCGDMAYEVLGDIELLPSRLPTLYRRLTE